MIYVSIKMTHVAVTPWTNYLQMNKCARYCGNTSEFTKMAYDDTKRIAIEVPFYCL